MKHLFHHQELLVRLQEEPPKEPMKFSRVKTKIRKHHELKKAS